MESKNNNQIRLTTRYFWLQISPWAKKERPDEKGNSPLVLGFGTFQANAYKKNKVAAITLGPSSQLSLSLCEWRKIRITIQ